jgi:hypothetical protein
MFLKRKEFVDIFRMKTTELFSVGCHLVEVLQGITKGIVWAIMRPLRPVD